MGIRGLLDRRVWIALLLLAAAGGVSVGILPQAPAARDAHEEPAAAPQAGAYLAGRFAQHVDDWKAAADYMNSALAQDPGDTTLLRRTFSLTLGGGRNEEALELANRLLALEPRTPLALLLLLADDAVHARWDASAQRLAAIPAEGVLKVATPLLAAWVALGRNGDAAAAEAALEPLAALSGLSGLRALHAGLIAELAGNREAATRWYDEAVKGGPATLRVVQAAGGFYRRSGREDDARALLQAFSRESADSLLLDPASLMEEGDLGGKPAVGSAAEGMAESLFDLASALHQEGSEEMALLYSRIALVLRPDFPLARLMVGDILFGRGHPEEALEQYRAIEKDIALNWSARVRIAESLNKAGRADEAVAVFEAMAAEKPDRSDPLVRLGDLHRMGKRYEKGAEAYGRALARIASPEERHWTVYFGRAACWERLSIWDKAEADLTRALELSPDQPLLLNFLGYGWVDKGVNIPRAKAMIERAVALRPKDGYIIDSLGWALFRIGDYKAAVIQLERAIELKPLDPTINDHLGDALWAIGRRGEALFQWRRALHEAEEAEQIEALRKKIQEREALPLNADQAKSLGKPI
jgi:tetratricopeptide (TPR) repeat protein